MKNEGENSSNILNEYTINPDKFICVNYFDSNYNKYNVKDSDSLENSKVFGNKFLINAIDHFSKFAWSFIVEKIDSKKAAQCLEEVFKMQLQN